MVSVIWTFCIHNDIWHQKIMLSSIFLTAGLTIFWEFYDSSLYILHHPSHSSACRITCSGYEKNSIFDLWKFFNGSHVIIILPGSIWAPHSQATSSNKWSLNAIVHGQIHTFSNNSWLISMYHINTIQCFSAGFYIMSDCNCFHLLIYIFHKPFLNTITLSIIFVIIN